MKYEVKEPKVLGNYPTQIKQWYNGKVITILKRHFQAL